MTRSIGRTVVFFLFAVSSVFAMASNGPVLEGTASSDRQWTGVAVSEKGRIFVNFPFWSDDVPVSVAEMIDGQVVPYPSPEWNDRDQSESFNAVQSVVIDSENRLWVLDTNNPKFNGVQKSGPVLFQFDLKTNQKVKRFAFPEGVYQPDSYYNDVRIDAEKGVAYITDSGNGALIVLNLETGKSRRLLDDQPSTQHEVDHLVCDGVKWENSVDADGIALTPDRDFLYYIALTSHTLYRIPTAVLSDTSLSDEKLSGYVEKVSTVPATDGMMFDKAGNLWMGGLENNAVNRLNASGELVQVIQDPSIRWADSFAIDQKGRVYFTTSQIHLPEEQRKQYEILSLNPESIPVK